LKLFAPMLETTTVRNAVMKNAASRGFINATDCADYLVKKGLPFRSAYQIVGKLVAYCIETENTLEGLSLNEYKQLSPLFDEDIYPAISLETCVAERKAYGGPSEESVRHQIALMRDFIEKH
jgi:argininosuccinate lyase